MTDQIELAIASVELDAPVEAVAEAHQKLKAYLRRGRELQAEFEAACVAWIKANGRDIRYAIDDHGGEMVLTTRDEKQVKCRSVAATLETLITNGDFEGVAGCLSSNAWKHGAVRKYLADLGVEDKFDQLFETTTKTRLADGGEPKLREIDTRYSG